MSNSLATHRVRLEGDAIGEHGFQCSHGDNLLRAGLRAGVGFPYECNSGGCGNCQFEVREGTVEDIWPAAPGLAPRARARGRKLACQSIVLSDCTVKFVPKSEFVPSKCATVAPARLVARRPLTADMAEFSLKTELPADFLAGQYALLQIPGVTGLRAYSMSNLANAEGVWAFIIKRTPGGLGTKSLFDLLQIGDEVVLDGPYGLSYLRPESPRDIVCVGGGSGISPLMSILTEAARTPELAQRRLHLFYGGRTPDDLCAADLLQRHAGLDLRVELTPAISDGAYEGSWDGERGFIHQVLGRWLDRQGRPADLEYYFCGPPPMTDAVHRLLMIERGVPAAQIHFDRFL